MGAAQNNSARRVLRAGGGKAMALWDCFLLLSPARLFLPEKYINGEEKYIKGRAKYVFLRGKYVFLPKKYINGRGEYVFPPVIYVFPPVIYIFLWEKHLNTTLPQQREHAAGRVLRRANTHFSSRLRKDSRP